MSVTLLEKVIELKFELQKASCAISVTVSGIIYSPVFSGSQETILVISEE